MKTIKILFILATAFASIALLPLSGCRKAGWTSATANDTIQSKNADAPGHFEAAMKPLVIDAPFYFDTPGSIDCDKIVPPESYVALYVDDGRVYVKVNVAESMRRDLLAKAVEIYNEMHPDARIEVGADAEAEFVRSGWIGASFGSLESTLLSSRTQAGLKYMPGLEIKPADSANDLAIWLQALGRVADFGLKRNLIDGRGIILIADASTNFHQVNEVMANLVYSRLPKVSLLTSEMAVYIDPMGAGTCDYSLKSRSIRLAGYLTLNYHFVKFNVSAPDQSAGSSDEPEEMEASEEDIEEVEEPEPEMEMMLEKVTDMESQFNRDNDDAVVLEVGGAFPGNAYCNVIVCRDGSETRMPIFNDFDNEGECVAAFLRKLNRQVEDALERLAMQWREGTLTEEDYDRLCREVCNDESIVQPVVMIEPRPDATYGAVMAAISAVRVAHIEKYGIFLNKLRQEEIIKD